MTVLLPKDAWLTDGIRRSSQLSDHTSDRFTIMHMLQVSKVEMRATTMPESEIHRTSASSIGRLRLRDNDMPIEISNITFSDCGSEMKVIGMIKHDLIIHNSDTIALH